MRLAVSVLGHELWAVELRLRTPDDEQVHLTVLDADTEIADDDHLEFGFQGPAEVDACLLPPHPPGS
jgi:hypothetical protein